MIFALKASSLKGRSLEAGHIHTRLVLVIYIFDHSALAMPPSGSFITRSGPNLNVRNMTVFSKPHVDIVLDAAQGSSDAYITSFSTLDEIRGVVRITARHDTRFDELEIAMLGE